jgi:hypothetical protein
VFLSILLWVIAAYLAWGVLAVIAAVGKPRKPITPGTAVAGVVIYTPLIAVLVIAALTLASQ